jgi:Protein of unknown function (DUF3309)
MFWKAAELTSNCQVDGGQSNLGRSGSSEMSLGTILLIILILVLLGVIPTWGYSRSWGYGPSGIVGVIVVILLVLLLMGRL